MTAKKRQAPKRYRFSELEARTKQAPNGWALERSSPEREDDRYTLFSNDPKCIGTTYHYGYISEVATAVAFIEQGLNPDGFPLTNKN